ncbi:MAG: cysteine dioxygenase family protein [Bacteroidales bacterium]|nr:cysteine dioxygenase family protein [Bacteroidales bacterium]
MKANLPKPLTSLIDSINDIENIDNTIIRSIVESHKFQAEVFSEFELFDHCSSKSYGRKLIFENEKFKMLLMSWAPGDITAIHNHGYTEWGCVCAFGELTHRLYSFDNNDLKIIDKTPILEGRIATVNGELIHLMGNTGNKNVATLHIYGANINRQNVSENSSIYLPEFNKIITTLGAAFLNPDKETVLSEMPFFAADKELLSDYYNLVSTYYERNKAFEALKTLEAKLQ